MPRRVLKQAVRVYSDGAVLSFHLGDAEHRMPRSPQIASHAESVSRGFLDDGDTDLILWLDERGLLEAERTSTPLSPRFVERHERTLRYLASYETDALSAQDMLLALHRSRVLVIGIGGVGSWITYSLMMSGIGTVTGVDGDTVELSNLNRSALYGPADLGLPKVEAASRTLDGLFPDQKFVGRRTWIDSADKVAQFADDADFVVSAADTPHQLIRMWVREGARMAGVPVIETMGGAIGPIRGRDAVDYDHGVAIDGNGVVRVATRNLNAIAQGPGVPPFHPMTDAAGVCQAVFETVSGARPSPLANGYVRKGALVNLGTFHSVKPDQHLPE